MSSLRDYISSFADQQNLERLKQCAEIEQALRECERIQEATEAAALSRQGNVSSSSLLVENVPVLRPSVSLHDCRAGMKIARFYGWGLRNPKAEEAVASMRGDKSFYSMQKEGVQNQQQQQQGNSKDIIDNSSIATNVATTAIATATRESVKQVDTCSSNNGKASSCSKEHHALWGCRAMALGCAKELVQLKKCFEENHDSTNNDPPYFCYDGAVPQQQQQQQQEGSSVTFQQRDKVCSESMRLLGECVTVKWKDLNERLNK